MFPLARWPPGLLYLGQHFGPPLLPVLIAHRLVPYNLPSYVWILAYTLALPVLLFVKRISQYLQDEQELKKLGARRVPQVQSYWPGGVDSLIKTVDSFANGYLADSWEDLSLELGPTFNFRLFWEDVIVTTEPDYIKVTPYTNILPDSYLVKYLKQAMLATDFDNFEKGPKFRWYMQSLLGIGVFNSDGDMWKFHRGMTRPFFARDRVTDFDMFDRHAEVVVTQLKERFAQGEAIDFQDIVSRFTLDSATEFLFGSCVHSLSAHLPYASNSPRGKTTIQPHPSDKFAVAFNQAQLQVALRARLGNSWPLAEFWKDRTQDPVKIINAYIDPILKDAMARKGTVEAQSPGGMNGAEDGTLLDHLVKQTDDPVVIKDETLNIMIAGRDTTMATLTFVIYCLSQHPHVLVKLREEILTHMGSSRRPTFDDIRECRYLRAVINETLRLFPPVPFNVRACKQSRVWPAPDGGKPYYIPAGVEIPYSVWLMHRRMDLWGPDAQEFDPDRFLDERLHKYLTPNPFIFLPFNAGPRICLGQQFAYNETSFMLVRLLQAFDTITLAPDAQPLESQPPESWKSASGRQAKEKLWPKSHLTLYSHKGLWLRMREARSRDTV